MKNVLLISAITTWAYYWSKKRKPKNKCEKTKAYNIAPAEHTAQGLSEAAEQSHNTAQFQGTNNLGANEPRQFKIAAQTPRSSARVIIAEPQKDEK